MLLSLLVGTILYIGLKSDDRVGTYQKSLRRLCHCKFNFCNQSLVVSYYLTIYANFKFDTDYFLL